MDERERRQERLRRALYIIRAELAIACVVPLFAGFLYVAAPGFSGGMFRKPPLIETLVPWFGVGLFIVGLVWMIRLSRPDPEAGERSWRYRDYE
jgi:Flp pilus assembly protein TadB